MLLFIKLLLENSNRHSMSVQYKSAKNCKQVSIAYNKEFFYLFTAHPVVLRHLRGDHKILSEIVISVL